MVSRLVLFHITSQSFQNELATKTWRKSHRFFFGGESQSKREAKIGFKSGPKRIWGCQGQPKIHAVGFLDFCWGLLRVMVGEPVGRIPTFTTEPPQRKLDRASPFLIGSGKFSWFFPGNSSWSGPHFPLKHDPPTVFLKETHDFCSWRRFLQSLPEKRLRWMYLWRRHMSHMDDGMGCLCCFFCWIEWCTICGYLVQIPNGEVHH